MRGKRHRFAEKALTYTHILRFEVEEASFIKKRSIFVAQLYTIYSSQQIMVDYQCPHCSHQFQLPGTLPVVHCPRCGKQIQMSQSEQPFQQENNPFQQGSPQYQQHQQGGQQYQQYQQGGQQYQYGPQPYYYNQPAPSIFDNGPSGKSRGVAGLLAILLGGFGAHYFYCGKIGGGVICMLLTLITCGIWSILTLVQGVVMMTMSVNEFERKFVYSNATFPLF